MPLQEALSPKDGGPRTEAASEWQLQQIKFSHAGRVSTRLKPRSIHPTIRTSTPLPLACYGVNTRHVQPSLHNGMDP